jgi:hypothetical protein
LNGTTGREPSIRPSRQRGEPGAGGKSASGVINPALEEGILRTFQNFWIGCAICSMSFVFSVGNPTHLPDSPPREKSASLHERDGQHDFDFEVGTWKTHLSRRLHPLTGSTSWAEYEGTTVVRKVWNGRANLVELEVDGPPGHIEALSLRLYNPQSHQWSLNFANRNDGGMSPPTVGEFRNGRGEFFDQETLNRRAILVRFVISDITADSCRFEQAFSDDGGKTWEVNWIATDTRVSNESDHVH